MLWTIARLLEAAAGHLRDRGADAPRLDAELLLAHVLGRSRLQLLVDHEMPVDDADRAILRELVRRRARGEPVAHLLGEREFHSLSFKVDGRCLVPRPETEHLVDEALAFIASRALEAPRVLDLGTGSGCIAISVAHHVPAAEVTAVDLSPEALDVARDNARRLVPSATIAFFEGDLDAPLDPETRFDLILSNPPYITTEEMAELPRDVRDFEPRLALWSGDDPVALHKRIVTLAATRLVAGGALMMEIGEGGEKRLAPWLAAEWPQASLRSVDDYAGTPRVVVIEGLEARPGIAGAGQTGL